MLIAKYYHIPINAE